MHALVTGGAGFIGSNLVDALVAEGHPTRVLDDLSTGYLENVPTEADVVEGSVADHAAVARAVRGAEVVFHLAAHRAVPRSIEDPLATDTVNAHGTLTLLKACADAGVRRVVNASSSSVYGSATTMPTPESEPLRPRSPYAVSKMAAEHYCRVFSELFGLETVSLRYFNVFGPRQRPDSSYAQVVPLFVDALQAGAAPIVHGDGCQSRAFVYVDDAVSASLAAARAPGQHCNGQAYNVAGCRSADLLEVLTMLGRILGVQPRPVHVGSRPGDVRHTSADVSAAARDLGFRPEVGLEEGLRRTVGWLSHSFGLAEPSAVQN